MSNTLKKKTHSLQRKKTYSKRKMSKLMKNLSRKNSNISRKENRTLFQMRKHWPSQEEKDTLPTKQKSLIPEEKDTQPSHIKKSLIQKKLDPRKIKQKKLNFLFLKKIRKSSSTPSRQEILNSLRKHLKLNPLIRKKINALKTKTTQLSLSLSSEKLNLLERRKMWTEHRLIQHVQMRTVRQHIHWTVWYFITRTRVAQERTAQDARIGISKTICHPRVMSRSLPHLTLDHQRKFSLSPASSVFPAVLSHTVLPLVLDPYLPCDDSRRSDPLKSHLPQVMSPNWSSPTTLSLEELSLTGILGQIYITPRQELWAMTIKILSLKIWKNLDKLVSRCPTFNQRCTPIIAYSDFEDGDLRKCWLHRCVFTDEGKMLILLEDPRLQGNQKQR